jgi:hypothetical protein
MSCTSFECIVHVYNIPSFKFSNHVIITACIFGFKILSYSWPSKRKVQIVVSLNICLCVCCIGWFCTVFMPLPYFCSFSQIKDWKLFHIHQILASIKVKILKYCKCGIIQIALWIAHLRKKTFIILQVPSTNQNASLDGILYVQLPYSWTQHYYAGQSVLSICHTWIERAITLFHILCNCIYQYFSTKSNKLYQVIR